MDGDRPLASSKLAAHRGNRRRQTRDHVHQTHVKQSQRSIIMTKLTSMTKDTNCKLAFGRTFGGAIAASQARAIAKLSLASDFAILFHRAAASVYLADTAPVYLSALSLSQRLWASALLSPIERAWHGELRACRSLPPPVFGAFAEKHH